MKKSWRLKGARAWDQVLVVLGLGVGILLGRGLEMCFGIGQYRATALFGALAGAGVGIMAWAATVARERDRVPARRLALAGAVPAALAFLVWFVWRVLPLIREEIRYSL